MSDKTVLDVITIDQIRALKALGFIVVHSQPTINMVRSSIRKGEFPEEVSTIDIYHRMVGESIKAQNKAIEI